MFFVSATDTGMSPMQTTSRLPGFYDLDTKQRMHNVAERAELPVEQQAALLGAAGLTPELADQMIENVVGVFALPLGVAANFVVNGRDVLVPMAIEEPSVVAGASFMAELARAGGGCWGGFLYTVGAA
ncbi:MAG TPA: hypothetical protein QGI30_05635, partial [Anaerolineales bacterium]|nr:hypothetical protein [Anaerolineales bacterium]